MTIDLHASVSTRIDHALDAAEVDRVRRAIEGRTT